MVVEKIPLFILTAVFCGVTAVTVARGVSFMSAGQRPFAARLANAATAYVAYLGKTLWPAHLAVAYPYPTTMPPWWQIAGAAILLSGVTAYALWTWRRRPYVAVGWFWYLGVLVPVIGIVQPGGFNYPDRCMYVPLIGVSMAVVFGLADAASAWRIPPRICAVAAAIPMLALTAAGSLQTSYWRDSATLFAHALEIAPDSSMAHYKVGMALLDEHNEVEAAVHLENALRIDPRFAGAHSALGALSAKQGKSELAVLHFRSALESEPGNALVHRLLADELLKQGNPTEAETHYREALRLDPGLTSAHRSLGNALARQGRNDQAIEHYKIAVKLDATDGYSHFNWGNLLCLKGEFQEALDHYRQAETLLPKDVDVLNSEIRLFLKFGNVDEAIARLGKVLEIDPRNAPAQAKLDELKSRAAAARIPEP